MTQSTPSATLNDIAAAAVAAYGGAKAPEMGPMWTTVDVTHANPNLQNAMDAKGFFGQVIIANRGTVGNAQNIVSDRVQECAW